MPSHVATNDFAHAVKARTASLYTKKQMGDACEMLVAAELTLAGTPALTVPTNWPHYDVIAQPMDTSAPLRVSVKARTYKKGAAYLEYKSTDAFDWLAMVILRCPSAQARRIFLVPRDVADRSARQDSATAKTANLRYFRIDEIDTKFSHYESNFQLLSCPTAISRP